MGFEQAVFDRITGRARRSVICTCGEAATFKTLHAANAWIDTHVAEGSEGCDHAVNMEDAA